MKKSLMVLLVAVLALTAIILLQISGNQNNSPSPGNTAVTAKNHAEQGVVIYKWLDSSGYLVFSDKKPAGAEFETIVINPSVNVFKFRGDPGSAGNKPDRKTELLESTQKISAEIGQKVRSAVNP